jgi:cytoskeletal protein RodZ
MITAGEVLKKKRISLGRSLEASSLETKIQKRFLSYIENNEFDKFDSEVFLTGFIKIYSQYLGLDTEKVLALYRRSVPRKKIKKNRSHGLSKTRLKKIILTPKVLISILSILFFIGVFGYIGLQIYKFQSPPTLKITTPIDGSTNDQPNVLITGSYTTGVIVNNINDTLVTVDANGNFSQEVQFNRRKQYHNHKSTKECKQHLGDH